MDEKQRIRDAIAGAGNKDTLFDIMAAAINLERLLYAEEDTIQALFRLRKSLEAMFGQYLPKVDGFGESL